MKTNGIQWNSMEFPMRSKVVVYLGGKSRKYLLRYFWPSGGGGFINTKLALLARAWNLSVSNVQSFWRMNVVGTVPRQPRNIPSWQEGQQRFHNLKTFKTWSPSVDLIWFNRVLCRQSLIYVQSGLKMSIGHQSKIEKIRDIDPVKSPKRLIHLNGDATPHYSEHRPQKRSEALLRGKCHKISQENNVAPRPPAGRGQNHRSHPRADASTGARRGHRISSGGCPTCPHWCSHPGSSTSGQPPRHCPRHPPARR